jgi:hypothetical protein
MGSLFLARPGDWDVVDWMITSRMESGVSAAIETLRFLRGAEGLTEAVQESALQAVRLQAAVFPALLGLASLSALGLGWWLFLRLAEGRGDGIEPLGEFRFHDHLVWVLILGLAILLSSSGALERLGANAVVFMGALYALRGVAVILFITGGLSLFGALLFLLGFILVAPLFLVGAFVIGLGDTWLNLRARIGGAGTT